MVSCIKVAHRFGHPAAGAKRITLSPNQFVLYISWECRVCFVKCGSFTIKNPFFFSLEILHGTDMIHKLYISIFVSKVIDFSRRGQSRITKSR